MSGQSIDRARGDYGVFRAEEFGDINEFKAGLAKNRTSNFKKTNKTVWFNLYLWTKKHIKHIVCDNMAVFRQPRFKALAKIMGPYGIRVVDYALLKLARPMS